MTPRPRSKASCRSARSLCSSPPSTEATGAKDEGREAGFPPLKVGTSLSSHHADAQAMATAQIPGKSTIGGASNLSSISRPILYLAPQHDTVNYDFNGKTCKNQTPPAPLPRTTTGSPFHSCSPVSSVFSFTASGLERFLGGIPQRQSHMKLYCLNVSQDHQAIHSATLEYRIIMVQTQGTGSKKVLIRNLGQLNRNDLTQS
jgi:hypothetical protein